MLIEILKHIQARDNLTDQQFAENIGIQRGSWNRIKNYRASFGKKFLSCVRQTYPELKDAIDIFLTSDITEGISDITAITTTPPETNQNKRWAIFYHQLIVLILALKRLFWRSKAKTATKS